MFAELVANGVNQVLFAMVQAEKGFAIATRLRMVVLAIRVTTVLALLTAGRLSVDPGATAAESSRRRRRTIGYLAGRSASASSCTSHGADHDDPPPSTASRSSCAGPAR